MLEKVQIQQALESNPNALTGIQIETFSGEKPVKLTLRRSGSPRWWRSEYAETDGTVHEDPEAKPTTMQEPHTVIIKDATYIIVSEISAESDPDTFRTYPRENRIIRVIVSPQADSDLLEVIGKL